MFYCVVVNTLGLCLSTHLDSLSLENVFNTTILSKWYTSPFVLLHRVVSTSYEHAVAFFTFFGYCPQRNHLTMRTICLQLLFTAKVMLLSLQRKWVKVNKNASLFAKSSICNAFLILNITECVHTLFLST